VSIKGPDLPEYENPPVIEVVCGVLFQPLGGLSGPYLGLLWERFREDYPMVQEMPILAPIVERFDVSPPAEAQFSQVTAWPRTWFIQKDETGLIQVQRDRFLYNWRKISEKHPYPRYHNVIGKFREHFSQFCDFLAEHDLGAIQPLQYEMTYINHIPEGEGWNTLADIGEVFPDLRWRSNSVRVFPSPESILWRAAFVLPNQQGRLHASIVNAQWEKDGRNINILILELTARGIGRNPSQEEMYAWFDLARESIVRTFTDLTSEIIQHAIWRRTR